ncbi:DUF3298 and DUF4163 domain-containing protein [Algoriphagus sp.]|uniref:DUF3298 and DUF4163 domain-containing protein n=1 Tax=Algoriphagus sp. TaxID=1872435 RepID=UPI00391AC031
MRIFSIMIFIALVSCKPKDQALETESESQLTFRTETLEKESCVGENCAKLKLSWPVASGGAATEKINRAIEDKMALLMQTGEDIAPLDTMISKYFRSFESFKAEMPDSYGGWEIEASAEVSYRSDSTLSIYFTQFSFLGGAHPNSMVSFLNFDPKTGNALSDDQLILDETTFFNLSEKKFKEYHEVEKGAKLADDGRFFLPETGFFLANAMGFKEDKFWVIYVPYEIGPYAMGYTELEFSREEVPTALRW